MYIQEKLYNTKDLNIQSDCIYHILCANLFEF